ncbi:MAG: isocitrate/isopropylmalate dehydrogenase family protein [Armatimonadota bacterium]
MTQYDIAVIPGDGIGREVVAEGLKVLRVAAEGSGVDLRLQRFDWGCDYYLSHGVMMPDDGVETVRGFDAVYLGAIGDPVRVPEEVSVRGVVFRLRFELDQFANVRPTQPMRGAPFPLSHVGQEEIDLVVVREATEGLYVGLGESAEAGTEAFEAHASLRRHFGRSRRLALQVGVFSEEGCRRVMRYAFELARKRDGKGLVTSCTKRNALNYGMALWDDVFEEVAGEYPDVTAEWCYVDALAMNLVLKPQHYDVIVAPNLFGDIITDLASALCGGLGFAPGGNIAPDGVSMFEPPHGTAPDIAGRGVANPIAAILTAGMMMEELGEPVMAEAIRRATAEVVAEGRIRTPDMGGRDGTADLGDAIAARLAA